MTIPEAYERRKATLRRAGLPTRQRALLTAFWQLSAVDQSVIVQCTESLAIGTTALRRARRGKQSANRRRVARRAGSHLGGAR